MKVKTEVSPLESILPMDRPASPQRESVHMDDVRDPASPAFKPSYGKPEDCNEGPDQARSNLLEDFNQGKESVPDTATRK